MKFGLTRDQQMLLKQRVVDPLEMLGAQIYCYGSRARGDHKPFSDLDLMVEVNTISPELESKVSEIQEQLTASNFPYKVDLVLSPQFADSYRPGYLRDRVRF